MQPAEAPAPTSFDDAEVDYAHATAAAADAADALLAEPHAHHGHHRRHSHHARSAERHRPVSALEARGPGGPLAVRQQPGRGGRGDGETLDEDGLPTDAAVDDLLNFAHSLDKTRLPLGLVLSA